MPFRDWFVLSGARTKLLILVMLGFIIRVLVTAFSEPMAYDFSLWAHWSRTLRFDPLDQFYRIQEQYTNVDHLPGTLWMLYLASAVFTAFGGTEFFTWQYEAVIRMLPTIADMIGCVLIYRIALLFGSERKALFAAAVVALNPAAIFAGALWGQFDSISMTLILAAFYIVHRFETRWLWAVPFLAYAMMMKPIVGPECLAILVIPIWRTLRSDVPPGTRVRSAITQTVGATILGIVTVGIMMYPFGIGFIGSNTGFSLFDRLTRAASVFPYRTSHATSMWMLGQSDTGKLIDDRAPILLGYSAHFIGNLLMITAFAVAIWVLIVVARSQASLAPGLAVTWIMVAFSFAAFVLPTRMHERYLMPAVILTILLFAVHRFNYWLLALAVVTGFSSFANQELLWPHIVVVLPEAWVDQILTPSLQALAALNLLLLIGIYTVPITRLLRRAELRQKADVSLPAM